VAAPSQRPKRKPAATPEARAVFLEALSKAYSVTEAARLAGFARSTAYLTRDQDDEFAAAWEDAVEQGTDVIRAEIRRRAVDGWDEPVYQRGELVGHVRKYSDRLLELEAKRRDPAYRDSVKVEGGEPVTFVLDSLLDRAARGRDAGDVVDGELVDEDDLRALDVGGEGEA
jgi:hypothetical protein